MTGANTDPTTTTVNTPPPAGAGSPPDPKPPEVKAPPAGAAPDAAAAAKAKDEADAAAKAKAAKEAGGGEKKRVVVADDDDDIPEDAEILEMSKKALAKRLNRHTKSQLRENFGTDKIDEIVTRLKRGAELEAKEETDRQARLTESEKMKEDLANEKKARKEAEGRLAKEQERTEFREYTSTAHSGLAEFIDPDYLDVELEKFGKAVADLTDKEAGHLARNPAKFREYAEKWAKERVEAKPKLAKDYEPTKKPETEEEKKKKTVLLRTGPGNNGRPEASPPQKTAIPGRPNSMNAAELREYKKQVGITR